VQRGFLPRGVLLSNEDLAILKAFDKNKDGKLEPEEMELAKAAFRAFDPSKDARAPAAAPRAAAPAPASGHGATMSAMTSRGPTPGGAAVGTTGLLPGGGSFYGARK
jgi:hypothetical protein